MSSHEPDPEGEHPTPRDRLVGVLVVEVIAGLIAIVSPLTPSRTGSTWSPAELFVTDPGYPARVLAAFVTVNLMIAVIGLVAWLYARLSPPS